MKQPGDFSGVIGELVAGRWHDPHTGVKQTIPVESIVIAECASRCGSQSLAPRK
jgi:hypothetical protein